METVNIQQRKAGKKQKVRKNAEWILALFAVAILIGVGFAGKNKTEVTTTEFIQSLYPDSSYTIEKINPEIFSLKGKQGQSESYAVIAEGTGYAGKIECISIFNQVYRITDIHIIRHKETPSYYKKLSRNNYLSDLQNKNIEALITPKKFPDAISGATKTCMGINEAIKKSAVKLGKRNGMFQDAEVVNGKLTIGYREGLVALLFVFGMLARINRLPYRTHIKWITVFLGLIFIGFVYNQPITLTRLSSILLGYWPDWQDELYIYLLVFGVFLILLTTGKNIYCHSICPLGNTQEILGKLGKSNTVQLPNPRFWIWFQRTLAWAALLIAVYFQNPTLSEYEVYGAIFQFTASKWVFILAALVIIASAIITRPWCHFLCPIKPIFSIVILVRYRIKSLMRKA